MKPEEIHHYEDDVFYFLKNGMSNLLIKSEEQMWTLTEKFNENVKNGHKILIICCSTMFIVYCLCTFIFIIFYKKVNIKKHKYLSLLNELDSNLIVSSLNKCEKFSQKLQEKNNSKETKNHDILFDSSSANYSYLIPLLRIIPRMKLILNILVNKIQMKKYLNIKMIKVKKIIN